MPSYICGGLAGSNAALVAQGHEERYEEDLVERMADQLMMGAALRDVLVELWSSELDDRLRSLVSGAVMNELVPPDELMEALPSLGSDPLSAFRALARDNGGNISVKRC